MQDRKKSYFKILKKEKISIKVSEPFNQITIDFILDFSKELKKNKKIYTYPNLIYLMLWCNNKKIQKLIDNFRDNELRLGRGLLFHICPSNVPTNFIYSFFLGLLSGNSNIIKVPSKNFEEKNIILLTIKKLFFKKKYKDLKSSNIFIQYNNQDIKRTKAISSISDGRIIWGGDKTINEIKNIWAPERTIDITFPDRYSLSLINLNELEKQKKDQIDILINKFYYDSYSMNQLACNSPHFIFWVGNKNLKLQNYFWDKLNQFVEKKFVFDDIHVLDKYSNLVENIISQLDFENLKRYKNNLYVINPNKKIDNIENIRGINGTFFQKNISEINKLSEFITKKCQTVAYFGFKKNELRNFMINNNLLGIDRIVPIGKSLDFDINWDGYETIKILSRIVPIN